MPTPSDFILRRARIHTLSGQTGATALAVRSGSIIAIGTESEVAAATRPETPTFDLGYRVVLPGFTDAHLHWAAFALMRRQLALDPGWSLAEVQRRVRARAADLDPGRWIIGRGWDHSHWGQWPTAAELDVAAPHHPVALTRKDGHVMWVNSKAMELVGLGPHMPDPPGGEIVRTGGLPTGLLKEMAISIIHRGIPEPDNVDRQAAMADAWPDAWAQGITGVHDMGFRTGNLFRDLATMRDAGELGLRFVWYLMQNDLDEAIGLGLRTGLGDPWLRVGGLKLFLDGTLGSQTAHMLAPFIGQPDNTGIAILDDATFTDLAARAAQAGIATAAHAIGDAANRKALDGFQAVRDAQPPQTKPLRQRVEHVQLLDPADIGRFAQVGVIASMQPIHAMADWETADRYWGTRSANGYAWRALLDAGSRLAFGSDAPIESLNVFAGIHAAVTRQTEDGRPGGGWYPRQRIAVAEAIHAYTAGAAWASGQEDVLGTLAVGKKADLIVLDRDPFAVPPPELLAVRVLGTMIEGVWVWQAPDVEFGGPRQGG